MRFTVKEPHIELYKDGFKDKCELGRSITGEKLSGLVESIADPMVIALDGAWGSGKSFFLKCWVGEHLNRADNTTETIYFDAFKHDFLDDPLIALTGAIAARFEKNEVAPKAVDTLKKIAPALGRTLLRVGISAATLDSLRAWSLQVERDAGLRDGLSSEEKARLKALERENRELRQANEILKKPETEQRQIVPVFLFQQKVFEKTNFLQRKRPLLPDNLPFVPRFPMLRILLVHSEIWPESRFFQKRRYFRKLDQCSQGLAAR